MAKINKVFGNNKKITMTSGAILAAFVAGSAFGDTTSESTTLAPLEYQGNSNDLKEAKDVMDSDLSALLGIKIDDEGLIYKVADKSVLTGANVVIDYSEGAAPKFVIGGYSKDGSEVTNNYVTLKQGDIDGPVYGGLSHYTSKNSSNRQDNLFIQDYHKAIANNNTIEVNAPLTTIRSLTGGLARINIIAGNTEDGSLGHINAYGRYSSLSANSNTVKILQNNIINTSVITGGQATLHIRTSNAKPLSTGAATDAHITGSNLLANQNNVNILKNNIVNTSVIGGQATLYIKTGNAIAGQQFAVTTIEGSSSLSALSNTVKIENGSTVNGSITGGQVSMDMTSGDSITNDNSSRTGSSISIKSSKLLAGENTVELDGILVSGDIIGGEINMKLTAGYRKEIKDTITTSGVIIEATGNTVTLDEHAKINNSETSLYGGKMTGNYKDNEQYSLPKFDLFTGNTLNMAARDINVKNVENFQNYEFTIYPDLANTKKAQLTAANIIFGTNDDNFTSDNSKNSTVEVIGIHSGKRLRAGDTFILMQATDSMSGNASGSESTDVAQQGISFLYNVKTYVDISGKKVTATILGCKDDSEECVIPPDENVNPQLKALSESRLSALTQITRGTDAFAYDVFDVMNTQADIETVNGGFFPFVMINGSQTRYHSGSHIDSNDFILASGISYQNDYLKTAVFVEGGWSSYDTYNIFLYANNVHGNGHNHYVGVGILGKYEFSNNFYADGSLRFGRSNNEFDTKDIQNLATGQYAQYSIKTPYASAHIGSGYVFDLNQTNALDISVKYLWTHLGGKNVTVASDPIQFQSIDSHRLRFQNKLTHQYNKNLSVNAGLSYEYEFDGKARATTYQYYNFNAASVRGSTGIASFGLYAQPSEQSPLKIDFSAQGYTGKREGIAANLRFDYAF